MYSLSFYHTNIYISLRPSGLHTLVLHEMVGVELGVGRSLSLEPGGWGGGKLSKLWGGTNLVKILLLLAATPEDGVVPEMWVLLTHLSVESSLFVSCWCLCRWWLDKDSVCIWHPQTIPAHILMDIKAELLVTTITIQTTQSKGTHS